LDLLRLHEERYAFVASPKLLAERPLAKAGDAAQHNLLDIHTDLPLFRYFRDARPAQETWSFQGIQRLGGIGAVRIRALEGAGVCVLPTYFIQRELKQRRLKRLFPKTQLPSDWFRLVWSRGHARAKDLSELAAELGQIPLR
jgi:DNA-binding transcriptional LysR family regulator